MQRKIPALVCMLLISTLLVACLGAYLKFEIFRPIGLMQDKSLVEVPFAVMKDSAAQFALENMRKEAEEPTEPPAESVTASRKPLKDAPPLPTMEPVILAAMEVTESWFDDVLFIGDSRTVGLRDFARLGDADYFCSVGLTVFDATRQKLSDQDFTDCDLQTVLKSKKYGKIYISLGLNECYQPYDLLMDGYVSLVETVRKNQPHAVIVLQGIITLGREKAASQPHFAIANLQKINAGISKLADGNMTRYIDANGYFADEEGYLPDERTWDGCHFDIPGYQEWAQWILNNAKTLNISFG